MKFNRPLTPPFVRQLDKYLLLNKPDTWSARAHLVVYYGLVFILLLAAICFVAPNDPRTDSNVSAWCVLVGIVSGIGFIVWLIYLLRFNVFKRFGIVTAGDRVKTYLLYFLSIAVMVLAVYVPPFVETVRANNAYTHEEISRDIDKMNLMVCELAYDSIPHRWKKVTYTVRDSVDRATDSESVEPDDQDSVAMAATVRNAYIIDTAELRNRLAEADSSVKVNDSTYYFYTCPDYRFVSRWNSMDDTLTEMPSVEIYNRVIRNYKMPDKKKVTDSLLSLVKKYDVEPKNDYYMYADGSDAYDAKLKRTYHLNYVNNSISNIISRMDRWKTGGKISVVENFSGLYYVTLALSLLVFVFRHTTVKTFFLTILTALLLLILTSLAAAFINIQAKDGMFITIGYYALFFLLSLLVVNSRKRNVVMGISLNITVCMTAFIPWIATLIYYYYVHKERNLMDIPFSEEFYRQEQLHYLYATFIGFIVLLVLIETLFKFLYRKWYASPGQ